MHLDKGQSRESLLKACDDGFLYFAKHFPELWSQVRYSQPVGLDSPFHDIPGTLSIYYSKKNRKWFFKDHEGEGYYGDIFNYVAFRYKLNFKRDFKKIMCMIQEEMKYYEPPLFNTYKLINNDTGEYIQLFK